MRQEINAVINRTTEIDQRIALVPLGSKIKKCMLQGSVCNEYADSFIIPCHHVISCRFHA
jgi:hypothetical protein